MAILHLILRLLTLLTAVYILGLSAWYIHRTRPGLSKTLWSVSIISGAASLWALISCVLACTKTPSLLLISGIFDLVFGGGLAVIAVLLRHSSNARCTGNRECNLNKAAFALAVAGAVLFFLLALLSFRRYNAYRKNCAFGPGPENGYSTAPSAAARKEVGGRSSRRWSDSEQTVETAGFTRHGAGGHQGYREPAARGSFDPELQHEGVRGYQAF